MEINLRTQLYSFMKKEFADTVKIKITKGYKLSDFNINPFVTTALASGIFGETSAINLAKSLIYPRIFGTSINTNFGDKMQTLCTHHLDAHASGVNGMDIEYVDHKTRQRIIMQLKAGPNTINSGDVTQIIEEMKSAARLFSQNKAADIPEFAIGITYGEPAEISAHYKKIKAAAIGSQFNIPIYVGKELWWRMTGNEHFYDELIKIVIEVFEHENYSSLLEKAIEKLAQEIEQRYFINGNFEVTGYHGAASSGAAA